MEVTLPDKAKLTVDGKPTTSTSSRRVFETPDLTPGSTFHYTLTASVVRDGKTQSVTRRVAVRAGETSKVKIEIPTTNDVAD